VDELRPSLVVSASAVSSETPSAAGCAFWPIDAGASWLVLGRKRTVGFFEFLGILGGARYQTRRWHLAAPSSFVMLIQIQEHLISVR
jgi:hypothetical protein